MRRVENGFRAGILRYKWFFAKPSCAAPLRQIMYNHLFLLLFFSGALGATATTFTHAQEYPNRPIRFIVPFPASGGGDIIIRALSQRLTERLGQAVVVDNRPSAGGTVAGGIVVRGNIHGAPLTNTMLLAIGDMCEEQLAKDRAADAPYR